VQIEFHDVGGGHQCRRHAARQQIARRILVVAGGDMAKPVDHALVVKNAIRGDDIVEQRRIGGVGGESSRERRRGQGGREKSATAQTREAAAWTVWHGRRFLTLYSAHLVGTSPQD